MKNTLFRPVIRVLALCLVLLAVLSTQALAAYSGTPKEPVQITDSTYAYLGLTSDNWGPYSGYYGIRNAEELYGFAALVNGGNRAAKAVLLQDIVVNETVSASGAAHTWTPIGSTLAKCFDGAFDGNGHTISGLYYNDPNASYVGLFGAVGYGSTSVSISNVTLANSYLCAGQYVGGIAGILAGEKVHISGCKIAQDVTVRAATEQDQACLGGIAGGRGSTNVGNSSDRTIKNCVVLGSIVREKEGNFAGAVFGQNPADGTAIVEVQDCYYRTGCLTINNETKNFGIGSVSNNYASDKGCAQIASASAEHSCLSISSAETKANCTYPGRSAHSFCLICGKVTSGTKAVTPADGVSHVYSPSDCLTDGVCQLCGDNKGKDPDKHHSSEYTYSPSATDSRKHDIFHKCCNAPAGESAEHTYKDYVCTLCNARCPHDNFTNGICNDCNAQGDRYIYYEWNGTAGELTQKVGVAPATAYTSQTSLNGGWYIVKGTKTVNQRIMINGDVHLILADGAHLNATKGISLYSGKSLHIYAQSTSLSTAGKLTANGTGMYNAGIGGSKRVPSKEPEYELNPNAGALTIHGGVISATGASGAAGIGATFGELVDDGSGGSVTIFGGHVTAKGGYGGAGIGSGGGRNTNAGTVTVRGGTVKAEGGKRATGIGSAQTNGEGADIVITGGSVWAIAGFDPEADYTLQPIGGGQQVPNDYTLKNANGDDLSLYTLVLDGAAASAQVTAISGTAAASYGVSDVYAQEGKLYFYLPAGSDIASTVSSVTAGGKTYYYTETSESGEHVYGLHAHSWAFSLNEWEDGIVAVCSGSGTCPVDNQTVTIRLFAPIDLIYNGQPKTVSVNQTPAGVFTDLPAVSYEGNCTDAGVHTASLTYGGVTAEKPFAIAPLDITGATVGPFDPRTYNGEAQVPKAAVTLANGMTVTGTWTTVTNVSDTSIFIASGNFAGAIENQPTGMKKRDPAAEDFTFAPPVNLVYDGSAKQPTVTTDRIGMGQYSVTCYRDDGGASMQPVDPVEGGTYFVVVSVEEGENYLAASSIRADAWKFTITQAQTAMTAATDSTAYAYGDTITVTGTADVLRQNAGIRRLFAGPTARQVALYDAGGYQLTDGVDVVNGEYTITYDTAEKGILPGEEIQLMVRFVGDSSLSDQTALTNAFTLAPKSLTPGVSGSVTKPYDGTTAVPADNSLTIALPDKLEGDSVTASASYAYADAATGTGKTVVASGIALGGTDAQFYALDADTASDAVGEITKAQAIPMSGTLDVANKHAQTYEIDLSESLPALEGGKVFGEISYALGAVELGSYYGGGAAISGAALRLPILAVDSSEEAQIGTVTVTVSSQNIADSTLTLAVSTTNHQHQWRFTASGDAITAACVNADGACYAEQVIIRLVAPADAELAYTGTAKTMTIEQTPAGMFDDLPAVSYCCKHGCTGVGEHTATLTYRGAVAEKKFTIGPVAASAGGNAEIVDGTKLIVTKDTRLPDSAAYYGEMAKAALEKKFGAENTVAKIKVHLQKASEEALAAMDSVTTGTASAQVLEISLKYWDEASDRWVKITEDTLGLVPEHGVEVVIPYDLFGFTDQENLPAYRFVIYHMITLPMDDAYQIGDIEDLSSETVATPEGLKVHVEHGFSPFVVGYVKTADQAAIGALPQTGDDSQMGLWLMLLALCGAGALTLRSRKRRAE